MAASNCAKAPLNSRTEITKISAAIAMAKNHATGRRLISSRTLCILGCLPCGFSSTFYALEGTHNPGLVASVDRPNLRLTQAISERLAARTGFVLLLE
jgi:hypothetical protein